MPSALLSPVAYALLGGLGWRVSLAVLLQDTECSRAHSFQDSVTGVVVGSWLLVVELVPSQQLPTGRLIGFSFSKAEKWFLKHLMFLRKHLARGTVLVFLSQLASPHPELRADTHQGIRGSTGQQPPPNLQSCLRSPCTKGHPTALFLQSLARQTSSLIPVVQQASLQKKIWNAQEKAFSSVSSPSTGEVTELGNAWKSKIDLKDLGRIIPLSSTLISFFFSSLSLSLPCVYFHLCQTLHP